MSSCIVYILYGGITRTFNWYLFIAINAALIEGVVFIINRWQFPSPELAQKHDDTGDPITDIYYPKWFVPHIFRFSTVMFIIGLLVLGINYLLQ